MLAQMKRLPITRAFSLGVFAEIAGMWAAWKNGIPAVPGSYQDQPPNLLLAFGVLDKAAARAQAAAMPATPPVDPAKPSRR